MIDTVLFLIFCLFYPRRVDFIRMGLGIKARRKQFSENWELHNNKVKTFILESLKDVADDNRNSLLILGCGRLYDFPIQVLPKFSCVTLVDADPLALFCAKFKLKRKFKGKVQTFCLDVTDAIDRLGKEEIPKVGDALKGVPAHDVVLSLNLLGQIPLYFLDRFDEKFLKDNEKEIHEFCARLQALHVKACFERSKDKTIFIFDKVFSFYSEGDLPQDVVAVEDKVFEDVHAASFLKEQWDWKVADDASHLIFAASYKK